MNLGEFRNLTKNLPDETLILEEDGDHSFHKTYFQIGTFELENKYPISYTYFYEKDTGDKSKKTITAVFKDY